MRYPIFLLAVLCLCTTVAFAQKKTLDHSVYDSWQSIGERQISNDGKWVVYAVSVQEGDNELVIQSADASYKKVVSRGHNALITEDNKYVVLKIKPFYKDTREARIRKKKPDEMPKDSLAIIALGQDSVWKKALVKTYKTPQQAPGWIAYHMEKEPKPDPKARTRGEGPEQKLADSLRRVIDSLEKIILQPAPKKNSRNKDELSDEENIFYTDAEGDEGAPGAGAEGGSDLVLRHTASGKEKTFANVTEYFFSKNGAKLVVEQTKDPADSLSQPKVLLVDLAKDRTDTISTGGNDFKGFAFSDDGTQLAYLAERDAKPKALRKIYRLWYYRDGMDSAMVIADTTIAGIPKGHAVSEFSNLSFSRSGKRLFFGTAPIPVPKDTTLAEIDIAKLDVWHYNDDYIQTVQLFRLQRDLRQNYMAMYDTDDKSIRQLESRELPNVYWTNEGDGDTFVGVTDFGKRIESQWSGNTRKDIYAVDVRTGQARLIRKDLSGLITQAFASPTGKYFVWYDSKARNYFMWDGKDIRNLTAGIKFPLYNEEHDSPSDPSPYGVMGWEQQDAAFYVYDRYDIWKIDPRAAAIPVAITNGRKSKVVNRYVQTDLEDRTIKPGQPVYLRQFHEADKRASLVTVTLAAGQVDAVYVQPGNHSIGIINKAKDAPAIIYTRESYIASPDLYVGSQVTAGGKAASAVKLSAINPQQDEYNWGTAELYKWTTFSGKRSEGILYKPEDFDSTKKYPMILYFYEKLSDGLNNYMAPAPTPSRLNIPFFVSRGYLVFAPNISYTTGHPAKSAYDYIVSAARNLAARKWVDEKNIGIQGQSWGGIQVAQLITMTDMFKAAWAGAPVANMTSAYGGIRWESGVVRQFQYEKTQSRIGATLWEKPELYIENSPLFHLPKVKTPLVIMANDADGAVPWYQGIELFTGMRRLGKKVWMLNYNGEAHNLVERRNRKDIQIREQQYFDWLLKGAKPAKWITEGVPAVNKGKDWGLSTE